MSADRANIPELVADIHESAIDGDIWQTVAERLSRCFPDARVSLWLEDRSRGEGTLLGHSGYETAFLGSYLEHYAACNPWLQNMKGAAQVGLHRTDQLRPRQDLLRSEFYADWLQPQAIEGGFGANIFNDDRRFMFVSALRDTTVRSPEEGELRLLGLLRPHLERAVQLHSQLAGALLLKDALLGALDLLPNAFVILGPDGRVVAMNRRAEDLLQRREGIFLRGDGTLVTERAAETARLKRMVEESLFLHKGNGVGGNGSSGMMLVRREERQALQLLLTPLPWKNGFCAGGLAGLFIHDPEARAPLPVEQLQAFYGLTPAEAGLALLLSEGETLSRYAEIKGVAVETARSQLKQAMAKLNVHREAQMVRKVLAMPQVKTADEGARGWEND